VGAGHEGGGRGGADALERLPGLEHGLDLARLQLLLLVVLEMRLMQRKGMLRHSAHLVGRIGGDEVLEARAPGAALRTERGQR